MKPPLLELDDVILLRIVVIGRELGEVLILLDHEGDASVQREEVLVLCLQVEAEEPEPHIVEGVFRLDGVDLPDEFAEVLKLLVLEQSDCVLVV